MKRQHLFALALFYIAFVVVLAGCSAPEPIELAGPVACDPATFRPNQAGSAWTQAEIAMICNLWLGNLPDIPDDPTNDYDTSEAAAA